jgi:hypothetical protein
MRLPGMLLPVVASGRWSSSAVHHESRRDGAADAVGRSRWRSPASVCRREPPSAELARVGWWWAALAALGAYVIAAGR